MTVRIISKYSDSVVPCAIAEPVGGSLILIVNCQKVSALGSESLLNSRMVDEDLGNQRSHNHDLGVC